MRTLLATFLLMSVSFCFGQAGSLDPTFANAGISLSQPCEITSVGQDVAALGDNTLMVATTCGAGGAMVTHLLNDGEVDTSFGVDGTAFLQSGLASIACGIAVAADGNILVVGSTSNSPGSSLFLARLLPNGTPDIGFGVDGIVLTDLSNTSEVGLGLTVQPDGRIVVVGSMIDPNGSKNGILLRYNMDGTLDSGFSGDGVKVITSWEFDDELRDVALTSDGSLVAAGMAVFEGNRRTLLVKVDSSGEFDSGLGGTGQLLADLGGAVDEAYGVLVASDQILVCGYQEEVPGARNAYLARLNGDGSPDATFNGTGVALVDLGENDVFYDESFQSNGQLLACGATGEFGTNRDLLLCRFNADGSADDTFGSGGLVATPVQAGLDEAYGMAVQPDARIVITGTSIDAGQSVVVVRYLSDACAVFPAVSPEALTLCPNGTSELTTSLFDTYQWYKNGAEIPGATGQTLPVTTADDAGSWFKVRTTIDTCFGFSDSVLVDGYAFLPPVVINAGDAPNLIGDNGEQIYCQGDDPVLVLGTPYDTNVQWSVNGEPIPGADDTLYAVPGSGSYTVEGAPSVCPDFIQDAGVTIEMDFHPYVQPTIYQTGILLCPQPEGVSSQWYYNGQPVADFEGCVIPIDAGNYTVFVDYGDSCSVLSAPFYLVGLDEYARTDMKASPVPTSDRVTITWTEGRPLPDWRVIDVTGRVVRSGSRATSPLTIDLGALDVGRYRFLSGDGRSLPLVVTR